MEAVLRMPRAISLRLRTSPLLLALAILPMLVIVILVSVLVWISFQTGIVGTPNVRYERSFIFVRNAEPGTRKSL